MKHLITTRRRGALMFSILFVTSLCLFSASAILIVAIEAWTAPANFAWAGPRPTWRAFAGMGVGFAVGFAFVWSIPCVFFAGLLLHGITAESPPLRLKPIVTQAMLAGIIVTSLPQVVVLLSMARHPGAGLLKWLVFLASCIAASAFCGWVAYRYLKILERRE